MKVWREWNGIRYYAHPWDMLAYLSDRHPAVWKLAKTALEILVITASSLFGVWLASMTVSG